jgi:hypothetical protein
VIVGVGLGALQTLEILCSEMNLLFQTGVARFPAMFFVGSEQLVFWEKIRELRLSKVVISPKIDVAIGRRCLT